MKMPGYWLVVEKFLFSYETEEYDVSLLVQMRKVCPRRDAGINQSLIPDQIALIFLTKHVYYFEGE